MRTKAERAKKRRIKKTKNTHKKNDNNTNQYRDRLTLVNNFSSFSYTQCIVSVSYLRLAHCLATPCVCGCVCVCLVCFLPSLFDHVMVCYGCERWVFKFMIFCSTIKWINNFHLKMDYLWIYFEWHTISSENFIGPIFFLLLVLLLIVYNNDMFRVQPKFFINFNTVNSVRTTRPSNSKCVEKHIEITFKDRTFF